MAIATPPVPTPAEEEPAPRTAAGGTPPRRGRLRELRELVRRADPAKLEPMDDFGWFGPDSVTWRVWSYPTAPTVGFSRSVVIEELDPFLIAPVKASSKIYSQVRVRYDRTLRYFATYLFADSRSIAKASEVLMKVHARAAAPDPVSGLLSDPNNPDEQLWIHLTAWHSILLTYELYGPGPLSAEDEARYWADCATAACAQTIDPDRVPRSREEVRDYFRLMRPRLAASEATQEAMRHLMTADAILPPLPAVLRPATWIGTQVFRAAVVATLPRYQRKLAGLRQPRVVDLAVRPVVRASMKLVARSPRLELAIIGLMSPSTVPVAGPVLMGIPPRTDEVVTPQESFRRHGVPTPAELYAQLGHDQGQVVFPPSAPVPAAVAELYEVR